MIMEMRKMKQFVLRSHRAYVVSLYCTMSSTERSLLTLDAVFRPLGVARPRKRACKTCGMRGLYLISSATDREFSFAESSV